MTAHAIPASGGRPMLITAQVALVLAAAAAGPLWLILLAPLLFGVPHVVADVRYLVLRGPASLDASALLALVVPLAVMTALRAATVAGAPSFPLVELGLGATAVAAAVAFAPKRRPVAAIVLVAVAASSLLAPRVALMVLLHGHNAFAFVIWWGWANGNLARKHRVAIAGAVVLGAVLITCGAFDAVSALASTAPLDPDSLARTLAPGLAPVAAARVVMLFAYSQALHYLVWVVVIPSAAAKWPSLRAELGTAGVVVVVLTAIAVPAAAIALPAAQIRATYLAVVAAHAWLELAIVAHLVVARARLT